jgi:glutathione S-transferase
MITVHKFHSALGQPDLSPFVLKLETYLRMTGIAYRGVPGDPRKSPKGKMPFIDHDGIQIGDSSLIIEHLKATFGDPLDARLSPKQRALATACQGMIEEQLYFVLLYTVWKEEAGWKVYRPILLDYLGAVGVPSLLRGVLVGRARKQIVQSLRAQGTGRHSLAEVEATGKRIVGAISELLSEGPYLLGADPASIDATVYGFLSGVLDLPFPSNVRAHAATLPNLRAYVDRMRAKYWTAAAP